MEQFEISVAWKQENHHFQVRDYMHHRDDQCKYEIFKDGEFVGSLEPDPHKHLNICKNPGIVEDGLLHLIADQLESYNI